MESLNRDAYALAEDRLLYYIKKRCLIAAADLSKEILKLKNKHVCECHVCESLERRIPVEMLYFRRTNYWWNGTGDDPNRGIAICKDGADEETEHWDAMWQEYYEGLL